MGGTVIDCTLMVFAAGARILLLVVAMKVEGTTSCPAPADVAAQLAAWLPPEANKDDARRVRLIEDGQDLIVRFEGPEHVLRGTRRFSRTYSCPELVAAVSVTIAAWQNDVHPDFASELTPATSNPAAPRIQVVADASPAAPPPSDTVTVSPSSTRASTRWGLALGFSVGLGAALDGPAAAGDATLATWLTPPAATSSLRFEVEGQSQRQVGLPGGSASWRRVSGGLGLERPLFPAGGRDDQAALRWFALARLGWLGLRGQGFAVNHSDQALDAGGSVGVRKPFIRGRWSFWGEVVVSAWPIHHDAVGPGALDVAQLPLTEIFVRIGAGPSASP